MGARNSEHKKSYSLEISENYYLTLRQILYYIAFEQKQPLNAIKVGEGINKAMNKIIENPLIYYYLLNSQKISTIYYDNNSY